MHCMKSGPGLLRIPASLLFCSAGVVTKAMIPDWSTIDFTRIIGLISGFVSQERSEVKVPLGGAASINIEMPEGTFGGEIEVVAETLVVDPTQVNTETVFARFATK